MDADTKRSLGGALMGALILLVGLALRSSTAYEVEAVGAILTTGGAIVAILCLGQVAIRLMRS
jgi:hypothetical protein